MAQWEAGNCFKINWNFLVGAKRKNSRSVKSGKQLSFISNNTSLLRFCLGLQIKCLIFVLYWKIWRKEITKSLAFLVHNSNRNVTLCNSTLFSFQVITGHISYVFTPLQFSIIPFPKTNATYFLFIIYLFFYSFKGYNSTVYIMSKDVLQHYPKKRLPESYISMVEKLLENRHVLPTIIGGFLRGIW